MLIEQLQQQDGRFGRLPDAALILGKGIDPAANHFDMWTCSFIPQASAYFRSVAMDGECLALATPESMRDNAGGLVPMRRAISACDKPEASRARRSSSSSKNSGSSRSYSFFTSGSERSFFLKSSWLNMTHLFHSTLGDGKFRTRRSVGLFDKTMQYDNAMSRCCTVKNSCYSLCAHKAQFKQAVFHGSAVWHSQSQDRRPSFARQV